LTLRRRNACHIVAIVTALLIAGRSNPLLGQSANQENIVQQIQQLKYSMSKVQAQMEESQRQLSDIQLQLNTLQASVAGPKSAAEPTRDASAPPRLPSDATSSNTSSDIEAIRERQDVQQAEIDTHEQTKVESESKYPVKITGLLVLNGFVNTRAVDMPSTPTVAISGSGETGATLRQTVLGFDARGPHLFGAQSYANLRVDFDGNPQANSSAGSFAGSYGTNSTLLRLRTARAALRWDNTEAFFSLDRPLLSPDTPTSLTAVAEPAFAWSGNLWAWSPQLGLTYNVEAGGSRALQLQAALIDPGDAPVYATLPSTPADTLVASTAERSRWPGAEARIALIGSKSEEDGAHLGVGGYFSRRLTPTGEPFNAWAGTLDARMKLPLRFQFTGSFYRGAALGGLGAGAYKDFVYRTSTQPPGYYYHPLDDVGGWVQLKEKVNERFEINAAVGLDNAFASQLRHYDVPNGTAYQNLARNLTYTGNVIYSPSAYLLFSLEYRHLESTPIAGDPTGSNIMGIAAGYKF
jgi:hypothetical protein